MPQKKAKKFLDESHLYRLGDLLTEQPHPSTLYLSEWAKEDLPQALGVLKEIELDAVKYLLGQADLLEPLQESINKTLQEGNKVFLCGCGATGRLSLSLETFWREKKLPEQVVSFMAGGDVALIRSIESFEDRKDFAERQLLDLGFSENDLLLGITEGGETNFVIGATEMAAKVSKRTPYFLYCNADDVLVDKVERSRKVIKNPNIHNISLPFGPMSLSGSTRLQASTVLMVAVASCLLNQKNSIKSYIEGFYQNLKNLDVSALERFIKLEAETYSQKEEIIYSTDSYGITILTDTTERSPTFSLHPFENFLDRGEGDRSWCYLHMENSRSAEEAWERLLCRSPRALMWESHSEIAGPSRLKGYDFSEGVFTKRDKNKEKVKQEIFYIKEKEKGVVWDFKGHQHLFNIDKKSSCKETEHFLLKVLLNIHSTLLMGRLDRYEGNCMNWVRPSNGKLIDRAARYIQTLSQRKGFHITYEQIIELIFVEQETLRSDESIVLKVLKNIKR